MFLISSSRCTRQSDSAPSKIEKSLVAKYIEFLVLPAVSRRLPRNIALRHLFPLYRKNVRCFGEKKTCATAESQRGSISAVASPRRSRAPNSRQEKLAIHRARELPLCRIVNRSNCSRLTFVEPIAGDNAATLILQNPNFLSKNELDLSHYRTDDYRKIILKSKFQPVDVSQHVYKIDMRNVEQKTEKKTPNAIFMTQIM